MNEIVKLEFIEGEARVSHELIAKGMGIEAISVRKLLDSHYEDFESFGGLSFEMTPFETNGGIQNKKMYYLNEQQATLAMTYLRNSDQARAFKMALVRAFYAMKSQLDSGNSGMGSAIELMASAQMQMSEGFRAMANSQMQMSEGINILAQGQNQIIELILQLQSNTPVRESEVMKNSISEAVKERLTCINPQFHDNPEEREMFTMNCVDILKKYPSGLSQGALLMKSDWPESTRTRRWLQDGIGAFWNMEVKPGRGYLYFI